MKTNHAKFSQYLTILFALTLVSCGGGGGSGGGNSAPVIKELIWSTPTAVIAPTAGSVISGQVALYKFTYPNDGTGDPAAQIVVSPGGDVAAYLCSTSACGPGHPSLFEHLSIAAVATSVSNQVWVVSPNAVTIYYVAISGNGATSTFTIQATGT